MNREVSSNGIDLTPLQPTKRLLDSNEIINYNDPTKRVKYDLSGATHDTLTTIKINSSVNRTITLPNSSGTLATTPSGDSFVTLTGSETLTNKTFGDEVKLFSGINTAPSIGFSAEPLLGFMRPSATVIDITCPQGGFVTPRVRFDFNTDKTYIYESNPVLYLGDTSGSASGTLSLGPGTNTLSNSAATGMLLTSTNWNFPNTYCCKITSGANVTSMASNTPTYIDQLSITVGGYDTSPSGNMAGANAITIRRTGYYLLEGMAYINSATGTNRLLDLQVAGVSVMKKQNIAYAFAGFQISCTQKCTSGNTIKMTVSQDAANPVNVGDAAGGSKMNSLTATYLGN